LHCVYATKEPEKERERERERGEDLRMASCNGEAIIRYNLLSIFFYFLK